MKRLSAIAVPLFATALLYGCGTLGNGGYSETDDEEVTQMEEYRPDEDPGWAPDESEIPPYFPEPLGWGCHYDETFNYDWHDDVICTNGAQSHRPYLLEGYDFVAYQDIMAAAAEYEVYLNRQ